MRRLPFTFYVLVQIAFLFVHYPTTRRFPRILSFACLLALLFYCYTEYSLQSSGEDYVLGCSNGILLVTAVHTTFFCPDFPDRLKRAGFMNKPSELPFAQKLSWMTELAGNMRRIGFTRDDGAMNSATVDLNINKRDPASSGARRRFVISRVILSVLCLVVFYSTLLHRLQKPSFNPALHKSAHDGRFIRADSSLLGRFWEVTVWTAGTVSEMTFLHSTAAALSVGVGAFQPEDWPPMFGSPTHAYSVRTFWSKSWHQILRVPLGRSGAHFAQNVLNLDKGTSGFMTVQSITAFFLSALIHTGGDYAIHRNFGRSGPTFQFFLLQPVAILIEEIAIRGTRCVLLSTRVRVRIPGLAWRGVGYLWVCLWFVWCAPPWLDTISAAGGNVRTRLIPLKMLEKLA
ncbi:hypothetical protein BDM02DRAFT_3183230 [Thelephora ganbajun]|uniref:Uncharacterized protein n=1 Tax=Thelephora ganbajun TaxID=370292 RepID=A0ACB6ZTF0_THEGA|nr:hypothetical protein BDM02DRAFT_3183230 [Thelephora ganbajun]